MPTITAADAKAAQAQAITDLETSQGQAALDEIYGIIDQQSKIGQDKFQVAIIPGLKNYLLNALLTDGYVVRPSLDGTSLWIIWE